MSVAHPAPAPAPASASVGVLAAMLEARAGQTLSPERLWRVETSLKPLLRERGLDTLDQLVKLLASDADPGLGDRIVDALLNGETSFFRDPAMFDTVAEAVTAAEGRGRRVRLWSAGCSTGQEPLSLAMLFAERAETQGTPIPDIVATDLSQAALTRAQAATFNQFEMQRGLPIRRALRWFEAQADGDWRADPAITRTVSYRRLNLVSPGWGVGTFDVILCRNVLLYVAAERRAAVFERLAAALRPGGLLVLGAGETVIGQTTLFEPSREFRGMYQRASAARAAA
jgi:chemotaxis protein methyltransferase CheR